MMTSDEFKNRRRIGFKQGGYTEPIAIEDPSRKRYDLLNDKIKIQEENIRKMYKDKSKYSDSDIESEVNQLNQFKKVRDKIKNDNKFENMKYLKCFENFS